MSTGDSQTGKNHKENYGVDCGWGEESNEEESKEEALSQSANGRSDRKTESLDRPAGEGSGRATWFTPNKRGIERVPSSMPAAPNRTRRHPWSRRPS